MLLKLRQKSWSAGSLSSFAGITIVANTFVWFLYSCKILSETINPNNPTINSPLFSNIQQNTVWGVTILGVVGASVLGFKISNNPSIKRSFIHYWMLAGIPLSLIPLVMDITFFPFLTVFFALVGVYFGLGMPITLGYFASVTKDNNRSSLGGLTFLTIFICVMLLSVLGVTDPKINGVVLANIKIIGLFIALKAKPFDNYIYKKDEVTYKQIFKNKTFLLYFIPWIMFSVANYIAAPIVTHISQALGPDIFNNSMMVENILAGVIAVVSGFVADRLGRRRLVLAGFVLLGLGYASIGLLKDNIFGWWFYTTADGIAWGIFYTMFLMTLWGDISLGKNSEKFYAIGYLPFLFSIFTEISVGTSISELVPSAAIFSFISLFLFVAVLPLAYAPETLSYQVIKNRELQNYLEKAQRAAERAN
jgi:MFS family permease